MFEPKNEIPLWRTIYEVLAQAEVDTVVTYDQLSEAIDADKSAVQSAVRRAGTELAKADNRAIEAVKNVGYRVVRPEEHMDLARTHQRKSGKSLVRSKSAVVHVDMESLEPETRKAFELTATALSMQIEFMNRLDIRQRSLERKVEEKSAATDEQVEELRARIAKLEGGV